MKGFPPGLTHGACKKNIFTSQFEKKIDNPWQHSIIPPTQMLS